MAPNSTKWRRRWTQSTSSASNLGLIQSDRRLSRMRWASDWPRASGGDFRLHSGETFPRLSPHMMVCRRGTLSPIVTIMGWSWVGGRSQPCSSPWVGKRLPLLRNARWQRLSLCRDHIVLSIECMLAPSVGTTLGHYNVTQCTAGRHIVQTDDTASVVSTVSSSSSPHWPPGRPPSCAL